MHSTCDLRAVCHVLHRANDEWYAIDDLSVQEILAQQVALTETYLQIFERADLTAEQVRAAPFDSIPSTVELPLSINAKTLSANNRVHARSAGGGSSCCSS